MKGKPWDFGALRTDGRWLKNGDAPFFWLGDTAWLLFHRLSKEETKTFLKNRADKGFTVIQAVAAMRMPAVNVYGDNAYINEEIAAPDAASPYWEHIDFVFDEAEKLGLYIGLLPTWGGVVKRGNYGANAAKAYGSFLARRFGGRKNLVWINGGDVMGTDCPDFWKTMGKTLKDACPDKLVTYHPFGRTMASDYFDGEDWLDFDMFQSGHRRYDQKSIGKQVFDDAHFYWYGEDNWKYVERAGGRGKIRPVLDGEPSYENIPQGLHDFTQPLWKASDVRRYAYWSLLAGACGFTYGHNAIMQFADGSGGSYGNRESWKDAIHHPGADCMTHMRKVFEGLPWQTGRAAQELLACEEGEKYERISVFAGNGFALFYTYTGRTVGVSAQAFAGPLDCWWINPLTGVRSYAGAFEGGEKHSFTPPKGFYDNTDWLLLLKEKG